MRPQFRLYHFDIVCFSIKMLPIMYRACRLCVFQMGSDSELLATVDFLPQFALKSLGNADTIMYSQAGNAFWLSRIVYSAFIKIHQKAMFAQDQPQRVQKLGLLLICGDRDIIRITSEYATEAPRHCAKLIIVSRQIIFERYGLVGAP